MHLNQAALAMIVVVVHAPAAAACFTMYGPNNRLVYQSRDAPFSMAGRISVSLARLHPAHHLVVTEQKSCEEFDARVTESGSSPPGYWKRAKEPPVVRNARVQAGQRP